MADKFRVVTKGDLARFDKESKELILWAVERGATCKVSNSNHAILRGPNGRTTAVPRKLPTANRAAQNARADVRRLFS